MAPRQVRVSRRGLGLGLLAAAWTNHRMLAQTPAPPPSSLEACQAEPGIRMLIEWRLGLPVVSLSELLPPSSWRLYTHPTLPLVFYYPPDWIPLAYWAEALSPAGMPIWGDQPPLIPQLSLARIVAPTQDAAFEFAVGNVQGPILNPSQAAWIAKQGLLGENPQLRPICALEDPNPIAPGWFHADYVQSSIVASGGNAIGHPHMFLPATTVTYQNLIGPRDRFADLVRTVFLRILTQFLGGGEMPTPQPDDGDDDDNNG